MPGIGSNAPDPDPGSQGYSFLCRGVYEAVSSSRSRWLMTPVMPSPRMLTP